MPLSYPAGGFTDETAFNKWLRSRIRGRGYQCLHVREADMPGPLDLVVWSSNTFVEGVRQDLVSWIELKLDDREVETSQLEFLRTQHREGVKACVVRYRNDTEIFEVAQMDRGGKLRTVFSTPNENELLSFIL
jgi:uncharacterized protein YkuJ